MKEFVKRFLRANGYELYKAADQKATIGSAGRPVGNMRFLLEDLRKRGLDCQTILDVGANTTDWSRMAKSIFPAARFFLIEPQREMKDNLERFCREFNDSAYFLAGAGPRSEKLMLTVWDDLAGSSFLPEPDKQLEATGKQREIEMITIDELIDSSSMATPELIKLDIQGFELEALKGATRTFGQTEVYIVETSLFCFSGMPGMPDIADVINFMLERGYVIYDFPGFSRRPLDGALAQCDICFVKRDGFLRKSTAWK